MMEWLLIIVITTGSIAGGVATETISMGSGDYAKLLCETSADRIDTEEITGGFASAFCVTRDNPDDN